MSSVLSGLRRATRYDDNVPSATILLRLPFGELRNFAACVRGKVEKKKIYIYAFVSTRRYVKKNGRAQKGRAINSLGVTRKNKKKKLDAFFFCTVILKLSGRPREIKSHDDFRVRV